MSKVGLCHPAGWVDTRRKLEDSDKVVEQLNRRSGGPWTIYDNDRGILSTAAFINSEYTCGSKPDLQISSAISRAPDERSVQCTVVGQRGH